MNVNFEAIEKAWFKSKKDKPNDKIWENRWNELKNWLIIHQGWYDENTCEIMQDEPYIEDILNEMEDIEKVINKPKKTVLDELEEWLLSEQDRYRNYLTTRPTNDSKYSSKYATQCALAQIDVILDKIQELKKR